MEGSAYITSESPADVSRRIVEVANVRRLDDFGSRRCYQAKYIVEVQAQFADPAVTQSTCHTSPPPPICASS